MSMSPIEFEIVYTYLSEVLPRDTSLEDIINMLHNDDDRIQVVFPFEDWNYKFLADHILSLVGSINKVAVTRPNTVRIGA
jgi:hypothetical protein